MANTSTKAATEADLVFGRMEQHDHEEVLFCFDRPTGLRAIIAIHDTTLGPAWAERACGPTPARSKP
jgi:glutamate dehydrogenase/leucine dehydrogenase